MPQKIQQMIKKDRTFSSSRLSTLCSEIRQRLDAKSFLETLGEIGGAAEAGVKGSLRYIPVLFPEKIKRTQKPVFA
jgi:hypothetical protein